MKKTFLLIPFAAFFLFSCTPDTKTNSSTSGSINDGTTTVNLDLSNFERYISYEKKEGYTGAGGFSPYEAWLEFKGLLSFAVYDATVTYVVGGTPYNFKLDASGGGKTDYFDRTSSCEITKVSGAVNYRL